MSTTTSLPASLRELGTELVAALVRALARAVGGLTSTFAMLGIAVPVGLAGCESSTASVASAAPPIATPSPVEVQAPPAADKELGDFRITFYYVIGEDEADRLAKRHEATHAAPGAPEAAPPDALGAGAVESTVMAAVEPTPLVTLYNGRDCAPIADVSAGFASAIALQGTGKLRDGRVVNVFGRCKCGETSRCYSVTGRTWGSAGNGRALDPFRTVAVDPKQVKLGSLLYIPALDGMTMPGRAPVGGFKHDGCVAADDTGGGIDGMQLDLFVARRVYYLGLARNRGSHGWAKHVKVMEGKLRCQRKGGRVSRVGASGSI
jgi:3D (Asp-Asp-Asp) domain-containing protein